MPIFLCLGSIDKDSREKSQAAGIREFMAKPVSIGLVAKTVRKVLN